MTEKAYAAGSEFPALTPGTLRLYSMRFCPYAQRARIVLNHKNIPHEIVNINLRRKPEWFTRDITPLGLVPVLQKDDIIVYESTIVCEYLDEVYPQDKLTPDDPYQKAKDNMLLERYSKVSSAYYKFYKSKSPEDMQELLAGIGVMERELEQRGTNFLGGNNPMMIDYFVWPHFELIYKAGIMHQNQLLTSERFPKLAQWIESMMKVPAVAKSMYPMEVFKQVAVAREKDVEHYDIGLEE